MIVSPKTAFEPERRLLELFGIYPIWFDNTYKGNRLLYNIRSLISIPLSIIFFLFNWVHIFMNLDDSALVINTLYYGLTQTNFVYKIFTITFHYDKFKEILDYLQSEQFNSYNKEQIEIVDKLIIIKKFRLVFRLAITMAVIFFSVFPFLNGDNLLVPSYSPIDEEKYRIPLYMYQLFTMTLDGFGQSAFDIMMCAMMSVASVQLDIIKDNLVHLRKHLDDSYENRAANNKIVAMRLKFCVEHHVAVISFLSKIESLFTYVEFLQFLSSSLIICATGFQVLMTPSTDLKAIALVLYFLCNLIEITLYCWFGHEVKTKSVEIGDACYMSDWYNCGTGNCRSLFIIMERAKIPVVLTAGKFFELTLQTLMQVLKTSYSYLALLNRMNEVKQF